MRIYLLQIKILFIIIICKLDVAAFAHFAFKFIGLSTVACEWGCLNIRRDFILSTDCVNMQIILLHVKWR